MDFRERFTNLSKALTRRTLERDSIKSRISSLEESVDKNKEQLSKLEKSSEVLQKLTELKKKETTEKIEKIISFGLQTIFEDPSYKFKIEDDIRRQQVVYSFKVYSDSFPTSEGMSILDSRGGGIVNIVSFLLRLVLMCMVDKKAERFLALDEPFSNLSENYHENLVTAVTQIVDKLNIQLLVVSHQKSLDSFGDTVYELKQVDGVTSAHLIRKS